MCVKGFGAIITAALDHFRCGESCAFVRETTQKHAHAIIRVGRSIGWSSWPLAALRFPSILAHLTSGLTFFQRIFSHTAEGKIAHPTNLLL